MAARKRKESDVHQFNVLLEDIRAQQNVVIEAVTSMRSDLERAFAARIEPLEQRIGLLMDAVRQNSADIRKNSEDIRKNSDDIRRLYEGLAEVRSELARLRSDFDQREERTRVAMLEKRVELLEARLGRS